MLGHKNLNIKGHTVMFLSFRTDRSGQTVQTQTSSLIRVYTVCYSVCIVWTHYSMVEPHSSNFRVITTNFLGVRIFRKFTVMVENIYLVHFVDRIRIKCKPENRSSAKARRIRNIRPECSKNLNLNLFMCFKHLIIPLK